MADRHTSTTTNDNLLDTYLERRLIKVLREKVWLFQLATKFPLPKGSGTGITFNGWKKLGAASATLSEGSANDAVNISSRKVTASIVQYGRAAKITDLLELTSIAPPVQGAVDELGHSAALTLDNVIQRAVFKNDLAQVGQNGSASDILSSYMSAQASAFCANTGTANNSNKQFGFPAVFGTSATRLSAVKKTGTSISARLGPIAVNKAVAELEDDSAETFGDGCYAAVAHPKALATMFSNADYKQYIINYESGPRDFMFKHEATKVHRVRFLRSANIPRYDKDSRVLNLTPVLGKDAVAVTTLDGGIKMMVKRPGPQSTNDPYDQNSTIAYKLNAVAAVLNPSAGRIMITSEEY